MDNGLIGMDNGATAMHNGLTAMDNWALGTDNGATEINNGDLVLHNGVEGMYNGGVLKIIGERLFKEREISQLKYSYQNYRFIKTLHTLLSYSKIYTFAAVNQLFCR